jgi:alkylation response protein AidB-like acyl-CoA dehydrogenase
MIGEMVLKIEAGRALVHRACATIDHEPDSPDIARLASMAKWLASDAAM